MPDPGDALVEAVRQGLGRCGVAPTDRLVVAVSGGVDSMVLLHVLVELQQPIVVVTIDHGLRDGSADDAAFVWAQAARLGVEAERVAVEVERGNVQAQAREARYRALGEVAQRRSCSAVATGHTATDQAETVLMALVRGAGLRGLAGMPERRALTDGVDVVRPMLQVSRAEVERAAETRGWTWREDVSNVSGDYWRNRLRHNVLPQLREEGGGGVDRRIAASAARARGAVEWMADRLAHASERSIPLDQLAHMSADAQRVIVAEALAQWAPEATRSAALVERVRTLIEVPVGACVAGGGIWVWRERDGLRIDTADPTPLGTLTVTPLPAVPTSFPPDPFTEVVDFGRAGDVTVRRWREGDRIRPLGLDGSQLVSDLLRERGVPRADRASAPVVARGSEILWVVGHRLAASVAVTAATERAAKWSWHPAEGPG